jgi:hypothetical protein
MYRVIVYVEGPSDKAAMYTLLAPLIEEKGRHGVRIDFFEGPPGDRKASVLRKVPLKAAAIITNNPAAIVVAMPDLYPRNKVFPHETVAELSAGILRAFNDVLEARGIRSDARLTGRFRVFCFKHDLEALILACHEQLGDHLGAKHLAVTWRIPVEDQDHDHPPRRVVEDLFAKFGQNYRATLDAPSILARCNYNEIARKCPQCFGPFIAFLQNL